MKIVAIIQARMNSERLPGKVTMNLVNKPVLIHIVERLSYCKMIDTIVVATSNESSDDSISNLCAENKINCFRGSLDDVLDRYYQCAKRYDADAILRITGDCPAIDPTIVDAVISEYKKGNYDCYGLGGEFPDGLDCTVYSSTALESAWRNAELPSEREHVGPYIEKNKELFNNGFLNAFSGLSNQRWTLDEPKDLSFLTKIFEELYDPKKPFSTNDILHFLEKNPHIYKINSKIIRNEGYLKSLEKDKKKYE